MSAEETMTVREAADLAGCSRWVVYHALGGEIEVVSWQPYQLSRVSVLRWMERRRLLARVREAAP